MLLLLIAENLKQTYIHIHIYMLNIVLRGNVEINALTKAGILLLMSNTRDTEPPPPHHIPSLLELMPRGMQ